MPDEKLKKLEAILKLVDESISRTEFVEAFNAVTEYVKGIDKKTDTEIQSIANSVKSALQRIETSATEATTSTSKDITSKAEKLIDEITFAKESFLAEAQAKLDAIKDGEDGKDADKDEIVAEVLAKIPPVEIKETTAEAIRDRLEQLEEEDRLDAKAIKNLPDYSKDIEGLKNGHMHAGSVGVNLTVGGTFRGQTRELIFTGSGVTSSLVGNKYVIVISGGGAGSGIATEEPVGAVDGSNLAFSVSNTPQYLVVDGVSKFETVHYTLSGLNITMLADNAPVQYIRSIYNA